LGNILLGSHGSGGNGRQPGLRLLGLPPPHELGKILGEVDRLSHFRTLRAQLSERLGLVLNALPRVIFVGASRLTN
jgi:hypothetical protein